MYCFNNRKFVKEKKEFSSSFLARGGLLFILCILRLPLLAVGVAAAVDVTVAFPNKLLQYP